MNVKAKPQVYSTYNGKLYHYKCLDEMLSADSEYQRVSKPAHPIWQFFSKHFTSNLIIQAVVLYLQIPHMIWAGDAYLQAGLLARVNPALDFLLYGVDLLEIASMVNITLLLIAKLKTR